MFLTICQACHKGRKLSADNGQKISFIKTIQKRFQPNSTSENIRPQSENILIAFSSQSPISEAIIILDFESKSTLITDFHDQFCLILSMFQDISYSFLILS